MRQTPPSVIVTLSPTTYQPIPFPLLTQSTKDRKSQRPTIQKSCRKTDTRVPIPTPLSLALDRPGDTARLQLLEPFQDSVFAAEADDDFRYA